MTRVYVSIGSNIEPDYHVRAAVRALRERFGELVVSPVYRNPAVGFDGNDFYNLAVGFDTDLEPEALADWFRELEAKYGRRRGEGKFAARTLDLDLLTWDQAVIDRPGLRLPRDEILRYAFVLKPLADIAGDEHHPELHRSYRDLWADFQGEHEGMTRLELTP
ncbi:2-amino-4-hydroxy-6-hydroxymethyldihydropteridine diphosphokinase [Alkalilimnicola ehrlichii MLHE-1]|uniref:2-amino-4-hydroxy-6-hydroxymethyldihydropteridine pyrophosphokinase n=1 Tax=Alkalilimnicola ehrlichii (strain ATCC BAA-1101 / DSM 17681 / MLHE-1) TaxID=187272 RepID=Q0A5M4_ALKEH|nr:2-amino-4-hydroxy-6-hydroxymethyldihydropteridine diphosphokinase [Alkalilimnicola ehrlichii]ABI57863.1 2-amino-4-hydroxy-6-hydroxymethyldihydropteridine pyrophosphokinase [Alkalilimnicola ehrlichii MLHE-1]